VKKKDLGRDPLIGSMVSVWVPKEGMSGR
jgi:hypothetical protein